MKSTNDPHLKPYTVFGVYENSDAGGPWYLGHVLALNPEDAADVALAATASDTAEQLVVYVVVAGHHTDELNLPDGKRLNDDCPPPFRVIGTAGTLIVDRHTGLVLSREPANRHVGAYQTILRIDPAYAPPPAPPVVGTLPDVQLESVGFWLSNGWYLPPGSLL